jgi:hypothetical protein
MLVHRLVDKLGKSPGDAVDVMRRRLWTPPDPPPKFTV